MIDFYNNGLVRLSKGKNNIIIEGLNKKDYNYIYNKIKNKYPKKVRKIKGNKIACKSNLSKFILNLTSTKCKIETEIVEMAYDYKNKIKLSDKEVDKVLKKHKYIRKPFDKGKFDFQTPAIKAGLKDNICHIIDQGLGKSYIAIETYRILKENNKINTLIIICKNSLKYNWLEEINKSTKNLDILVLNKANDKKDNATSEIIYKEHKNKDIIIINSETIKSEYKELSKIFNKNKCMLIGDESHWYKNKATNNYKNVKKLAKKAYRTILLSGTMITKDPEDLYVQMDIIGAPIFPTSLQTYRFMYKHFKTINKRGRKIFLFDKYKNGAIENIKEKIKDWHIRYTKKQCLNLEEKEYKIEYINNDGTINKIALEIKKLGNCINKIGTLVPSLVKLSKYKAKNSINIIKKYIKKAKNNKVVVWTTYREVAQYLHRELNEYNPELIMGGIDPIIRQEKVNNFNNNKNVKVLIATAKGGREGINLVSSNISISIDRSFDLVDELQKHDRIYRIGQDTKCHIITIVVNNSFDKFIDQNLEKKMKFIEQIYDDDGLEINQNNTSISLKDINDIMKGVI